MPQVIEQWGILKRLRRAIVGQSLLDVDLEATFTLGHPRGRGARLLRRRRHLSRPLHARHARASGATGRVATSPALDGKTGAFAVRPAVRRQSRAGARAQPASTSPMPTARRTSRSAPPATPGRTSRSTCRHRRSRRCGRRASTRCAWACSPSTTPSTRTSRCYDVFERGADGKLDFDRPNPVAFRHFETQVGALRDLGIEADIIIFHPYDRWGYCDMSAEQDYRYVAISSARLARLSQRLVVARQRIRLPARHQADRALGPLSSTSSRRTTPTGI